MKINCPVLGQIKLKLILILIGKNMQGSPIPSTSNNQSLQWAIVRFSNLLLLLPNGDSSGVKRLARSVAVSGIGGRVKALWKVLGLHVTSSRSPKVKRPSLNLDQRENKHHHQRKN